MDPVVHFEMPADDQKRAGEFYSRVFGWQTNQLGEEMGNYMVVETTEVDANRMPKKAGAINGGIYKKFKDGQVPSVVISVQDIQASMKKVAAAGGKVLGGQKPGIPDDIPGIGLYCSFIDTEGNRVGMLQPIDMAQGKPKGT